MKELNSKRKKSSKSRERTFQSIFIFFSSYLFRSCLFYVRTLVLLRPLRWNPSGKEKTAMSSIEKRMSIKRKSNFFRGLTKRQHQLVPVEILHPFKSLKTWILKRWIILQLLDSIHWQIPIRIRRMTKFLPTKYVEISTFYFSSVLHSSFVIRIVFCFLFFFS